MASLSSGTRLGAYQVIGAIGAGGMGEVYRARDAKLNRDVALKVLPQLFAVDPDRLARFKREAHVLASLNHPNIGAIYGLEESNGLQALVLELIEGPTLADRLDDGPIPMDEAVPIARQIAEALEAAHEMGIVHRDLKPANIKLRDDGAVKVLDFGLAKAADPIEAISSSATASPTITSPALTQMGVILGTAAYMSPEQVKGRPADKRSDVWAFGVVLLEMLSGQRAFKGGDVPDTLAAVLRQPVDLTTLPASTPPAVRSLIARCLERDVKHRLRDIGEARIVLEDPGALAGERASPVAAAARRPFWRRAMPAILAAAAAAALTATAAWYLTRRPEQRPAISRFTVPLPDGLAFPGATPRQVIALSREGTLIAYAANAGLYLRSMSDETARVIPGTEQYQSLSDPVFSPDTRSILFYVSEDQTIKRIPIAGGRPTTICQAASPYGISWGPHGVVFGQGRGGIMRVAPEGGAPAPIVRVKEDEEAHGPQLLPDGRHVLYTLAAGPGIDRWNTARIVVQPVPAEQAASSGEATTLIEGGTDARYLPTGHLVYSADRSLVAVAFDARRFTMSGPREPLVHDVRWSGGRTTGAIHFSISDSGSLIYLQAFSFSERGAVEMVLTDRSGAIERLKLPLARYAYPRVSPDGKLVALEIQDGRASSIYTYELSGATNMQRLQSGSNDRYPVWSSDSRRVAFQSDRGGDPAIWQSTIGGTAERLTTPAKGESHAPESWSPTADVLLYSVTRGADVSLWTIASPDRTPVPFGNVHSTYPTDARFHPSGRWVAYASREGQGSSGIYVQPYPSTGPRYQLFVKGRDPASHKVAWSRDGTELFYVPRIFEFEAVRVTTEPAFAFGNAVTVPRPFNPGAPNMRSMYDVAPLGKFIGVIPPGQTQAAPRTAQEIHVVLNWFEELRARVPPAR